MILAASFTSGWQDPPAPQPISGLKKKHSAPLNHTKKTVLVTAVPWAGLTDCPVKSNTSHRVCYWQWSHLLHPLGTVQAEHSSLPTCCSELMVPLLRALLAEGLAREQGEAIWAQVCVRQWPSPQCMGPSPSGAVCRTVGAVG